MNISSEIEYWDNWIGSGEFDMEYLEKQFTTKHKKLFLYSDSHIEGFLIYKKVFGIYLITLMAKRKNSAVKKIGKQFLDHFKTGNTLLLADDSDIPNYYSNLGFTKTNRRYYKWLLNDYKADIYVLIL